MERFNSRKIDELGRIALHTEIRKSLGMQERNSFSYLLAFDRVLIMKKTSDNTNNNCLQIDDLGRLTLPKELQQALNWKANDDIAIYFSKELLYLQSK